MKPIPNVNGQKKMPKKKARGVKRVKSSTILVNQLYFQVCPLAHNPELWNGNMVASVVDSPHVDFLRLRMSAGRKKSIKRLYKTKYCQMYEYWDKCLYGLGGRTPKYILRKATSLLNVFDSISKNGFDKSSRIQVLKTPLWISRGHSGGEHLKAPEIFHGHHRIACLYVLGIKEVNVDMCKDILASTKVWPQKLRMEH